MILAIASGKGGTGKTTVATNLARVIGDGVQLLDCDVEEPNAHLFLAGAPVACAEVFVPVPDVDASLCDGCGECGRFCAFHAIVSFGTSPLVFPELCHGCGGCAKVCPRGAIRESSRRIGVVESFRSGEISLIHGRLDVGVASAPPLIRAVKDRIDRTRPAILDAPPGTACTVVATLRGADHVVLVAEPTPFGLHDLALAVPVVRELGIDCSVVVNRVGQGDDRVHAYCREQALPVLLDIPDDRGIAEAYSRGALIVEALPRYAELFARLRDRIMQKLQRTG